MKSGLLLALLVAAVYVALRPPLYDFDGVMYRVHAAEPPALQINAHHVAWHAVQRGLLRLGGAPRTFQYFGIAVTAAALLAFYALLARASRPDLALVATVLVAFSPQVWWLGLENQPYPLVFLFVVLYLHAWAVPAKTAPSGWRLVGAGAALAAAVLFHQGAAVLAVGGMLALAFAGEGLRRARIVTALAWGAATAAAVLAGYLWIGRVVDWRGWQGFLRWTTGYLRNQHPIQVEMPDYLAKSMIGISRALLETDALEGVLARFSYGQVLWLYGAAGVLAAAALGFACRRLPVRALLRSNPLFAVSLASLLCWSAFVFAWEPLGYYWSLALFLGFACAAAARRDARPWGLRMKIALAATVALSAWNVYASNARDRAGGINAPESLVPSIEAQLGPRDVFVVLRQDWSGGMDYDLFFEMLTRRPRNPAIFLIEDFVLGRDPEPWPDRLSRRIESVWAAGGRLFAAEALFDDATYADLARARNPFSTFVEESYRGIDGPALQRDIQTLFDGYIMVPSVFHIGSNSFVEVRRSN
jgi:hypothetical protein